MVKECLLYFPGVLLWWPNLIKLAFSPTLRTILSNVSWQLLLSCYDAFACGMACGNLCDSAHEPFKRRSTVICFWYLLIDPGSCSSCSYPRTPTSQLDFNFWIVASYLDGIFRCFSVSYSLPPRQCNITCSCSERSWQQVRQT